MIPIVFVRNAYNYDMNAAGDESGLECKDVSLTHQSFKEEVDINTIVDRFGIGYEPPVGIAAPRYEDFTEVFDFHSAMNAIAKAREAFDAMSAQVRSEFDNDPAKFVDFFEKEENRPRGEKLGLVIPKPIAPASVVVAPAPAAATPPVPGSLPPGAP